MSWEEAVDPLCQHLARRRRVGIGWVGQLLDHSATRSPGLRAATFSEKVTSRPAEEGARQRFDWRKKGRSEVPTGIVSAMNHCQKPYHLWNCERPEVKHRYQLERQPRLSFGEGIEGGERGMPEHLETSTRALASWISDQEFEDLILARNRQNDRELLSKPLPFGKADHEKGLGPAIDLLAPPGGGFSMGPPGGFPPPPPPPRSPGQT